MIWTRKLQSQLFLHVLNQASQSFKIGYIRYLNSIKEQGTLQCPMPWARGFTLLSHLIFTTLFEKKTVISPGLQRNWSRCQRLTMYQEAWNESWLAPESDTLILYYRCLFTAAAAATITATTTTLLLLLLTSAVAAAATTSKYTFT